MLAVVKCLHYSRLHLLFVLAIAIVRARTVEVQTNVPIKVVVLNCPAGVGHGVYGRRHGAPVKCNKHWARVPRKTPAAALA